jgi:hypothetical protein
MLSVAENGVISLKAIISSLNKKCVQFVYLYKDLDITFNNNVVNQGKFFYVYDWMLTISTFLWILNLTSLTQMLE